MAPIEAGRYFAEHIPGAVLLELDSADHWPYFGDAEIVLGEVQEFLTGARSTPAPESMLATVLCTEVAQAGAYALWLGDKRWTASSIPIAIGPRAIRPSAPLRLAGEASYTVTSMRGL